MDGLDSLMKDISSSAPSLQRQDSSSSGKKRDLIRSSADELIEAEYTEESEENIRAVIAAYKNILQDLADPKVNENINEALSRVNYSSFVQYYLENANLSHYSIERELNRLDFEVTYNGETSTDNSFIQDAFWETKLDDLWRLANQSIYADVLSGVRKYFEHSNLNVSAVASKCIFKLDIDERRLRSEGFFDIVLESHKVESHRIKVATIQGNIDASMKHKIIKQWLSQPSMSMVFDSDLRGAAITYLELEDDYHSFSDSSSTRKIDTIVDAVADTAQILPGQITSMMSEISLERALGFMGKLIGAHASEENENALSELTSGLDKRSCNEKKSSITNIVKDNDEEWDDWD